MALTLKDSLCFQIVVHFLDYFFVSFLFAILAILTQSCILVLSRNLT